MILMELIPIYLKIPDLGDETITETNTSNLQDLVNSKR